jgi:hypothetical protein
MPTLRYASNLLTRRLPPECRNTAISFIDSLSHGFRPQEGSFSSLSRYQSDSPRKSKPNAAKSQTEIPPLPAFSFESLGIKGPTKVFIIIFLTITGCIETAIYGTFIYRKYYQGSEEEDWITFLSKRYLRRKNGVDETSTKD